MKPIFLLTAILLLGIGKYMLSNTEAVRKPIRVPRGNTNDIYRCCEDKCFLLKSYTEQEPVKEVTKKEIFDSYGEDTIIFNTRWCSWDY